MTRFSTFRTSIVRGALVAVAAFGLVVAGLADADARGGKGSNVGSRGTNTYKAPPSTNTAPGQAQGIQKSMTQPGAVAGAATAGTAAAAATQAAKGSMMRNLLLGGLIGAGLASMFGAGALANVLGFVLQGLLIAGIVMLVVMLVRRMMGGTPTPAAATATAGPARQPLNQPLQRAGLATGGALPALQVVDADFDTFQRLLTEVQAAYSANDINALGDRLTPEMLSYFAGELDDNRKKGIRNELGPVSLLQGDLSEAWREAGSEFATVAMRYSLTDATIDRSGNVVAGDRTRPQEVTELWTFRRDPNTGPNKWELSAIQQTS
jgi:predicted lipid-binding transport protein (Tim44 family)